MTTEKAIERLKSSTGIEYSDEQLAILKARGGMRVLASAGSGKTTVLTHLVAKRILTGEIDPDTTMCTTFSKEGAGEMQQRLIELLQLVGVYTQVECRTMHSTYYQLIKKLGSKREQEFDLCSNLNRTKFIRKAIKTNNLELTDEDILGVDSLLSYRINNLLSYEALANSPAYKIPLTVEELRAVAEEYSKLKREAHMLDFDDIQLLVYVHLVKNRDSKWIDYCRTKWKYIYVDEFQDVSKLQYAILEALCSDVSNLVVIGDDDQSIYEWRGANPRLILEICGTAGIPSYNLSVNYRCKNKIVDMAARGIQNNAVRASKTLTANQEGGEVKLSLCDTNNLFEVSYKGLEYIKGLLKEGKATPDDIAILSRNNAHLHILNAMLTREGIPTVSRLDIKLSQSQLMRDIQGVMDMVEPMYNTDIVTQVLWKVVEYLGVRGAKLVAKVMTVLCTDLATALDFCCNPASVTIGSAILRNQLEKNIEGQFRRDTLISMSELSNLIKSKEEKKGAAAAEEEEEQEEQEEKAVALLGMYSRGTMFMYTGADKQRVITSLIKFICWLLKEDGYSTTNALLQNIFKTDEGTKGVTLSTVHSAKGKEWKYVIIFADDNVSFPNLGAMQGILQSPNVSQSDIREVYRQLDEERRLHYVAMTRAKEELYILTSKTTPSILLLESLGKINLGNVKIVGLLKQDLLEKEIFREAQNMVEGL